MTRLALVTILLFVTPSFAAAQQGTSELRGRAVDQQGGALPGVPIVVTNQDNGTFRETVSGADGAFLLSGMTPGTYEVRAEMTGCPRTNPVKHAPFLFSFHKKISSAFVFEFRLV